MLDPLLMAMAAALVMPAFAHVLTWWRLRR